MINKRSLPSTRNSPSRVKLTLLSSMIMSTGLRKCSRRLSVYYWKLLIIALSTTLILNTQRHGGETIVISYSEVPESFPTHASKVLQYEGYPATEDPFSELRIPGGCSISGICGDGSGRVGIRLVEGFDYEIRTPVPPSEEIHTLSASKEVAALRTWPSGKEAHLEDVRDYFDHLETPQMSCGKLVMVGGSPTCDRTSNFLDGNKVICMDPQLELLTGGHPDKCLTLSFGVNFDTTFDQAVADLPCEVHLFDVLDFSPVQLLEKKRHVHFHKVGLAETPRSNFYTDINQSLPVNSLDGLLVDYNLMFRPIHVLKLDIEDDEWPVFEHLVKQPIFDAIGQIAMEVHAEALGKLPSKKQLPYIQKRYRILRAIEERGFRLVAYWPNRQPRGYKDADTGRHYDLCGELLYVNSNWYNVTFKNTLKNFGFRFQ
ncbi:probable methyltransferase-like protein 24 [Macrobrachium rosenbergii]|uniref:probable methyltransferase-like protein 24 n=1 Tax=Macrobrachium rosenbergii TaxID=79674 RepID=UPI0034D5A3B8